LIPQLSTDDYPVLRDRSRDKRLSNDPTIQKLLQTGALLEYMNGGDPWCDLHPLIRATVLERAG
jgi:hypothetical protein